MYEQLAFDIEVPTTKHKAFFYRHGIYYYEVHDSFEYARAFLNAGDDRETHASSHIEDWYGNIVWGKEMDSSRRAVKY